METKEQLRNNYENACNAYVKELEKMWELGEDSGWWAGDAVGEVYCFLDTETLRMDEIITCVEENVSIDEYFKWSEYNTFANEFNQNIINLKSWLMGCPRLSEKEIANLKKLKQDLDDAIKLYKEKF